MTQKRLFFFQVIASVFAGASLLCLVLLSFHTFPSLRFLDDATSYGPWLEEGLKFIVVLVLIRLAYLTPLTIPFVGIGFGLLESINYFINRGVGSIVPFLAHVVFGFAMAFFFYLAKNQKYSSLRSIWYALALLIPVYFHLLYNIAMKSLFM